MNKSNRPELSDGLPAEEFAAWYWLKEELVEFCRAHGVSPTGAKREIEARILDFLAGRRVGPGKAGSGKAGTGKAGRVTAKRSGGGDASGVSDGYGDWGRLAVRPGAGGLLRGELGGGFRFNAAVREFVHTGKGKRLGDVERCWRESLRETRAIPEQLEYNRHFRRYFREHPGARRAEAIAAWWKLRGKRKES